jgi:cytochrome c553
MDQFMRVHYEDTELIRSAVIAGRPEDTGRPAESLLELLDIDELPPAWVEPMERMQASARRVKDSSDVPGVAAATADIGTSCGWCHQKLGGPTVEVTEPPADDGSLDSRMKRHVWATERLWEGLYVPSTDAWERGAHVLSTSPFPPEILKKGGLYAKSAAADFAKLAAVAPKKTTTADRAALYAQLLGTCATCHLSME